jgi:hypothetical protein
MDHLKKAVQMNSTKPKVRECNMDRYRENIHCHGFSATNVTVNVKPSMRATTVALFQSFKKC